ncbi:MAG: Multimodular transpeptidase-transglycosylase [uncultured Rubrobacteraceae bacterium]|uniref:Multimodular transpeptidase-transglycosylase n=1 Tax=uncultured Rubrobacteraceae bacterium TaxID=349277 RepID=A0A6J4R411_9ACTN|nr:MAG: Multimodular transpeptidase-transglycosylase [uncultured Rubrobacteraceae bacterium]
MHNSDLVRIGRRRRRTRNKSKLLQRLRTAFLLLCFVTILGLVGMVASAVSTYQAFAANMPDLGDYRSTELAQTSLIYDTNGNIVDQLYGVQNRFVVPLEEVDPTLRQAVISIEDHRFYRHRGLDFEAIGRAAVENVTSLSIQEGGSTLTQQLIKNTYIAQQERQVASFERKFVEGSLAWQYEKEHPKDEILEQYLNTVYFGANAYGAEAAAETYFNEKASDLTLSESALLAGIINLPGVYDPFADPKSAKARRNVVLDRMLEYGHISRKERDRAVASKLDVSRGRVQYQNDNEYFLNAVRKEIAEEYGDDMVYEGGLEIYTTLDPDLQAMANDAVDSIVNPEAGDPSASLVSVEPETGAVRAMVGGSDFDQVKFNLATQAHRQAGSSFKPFVYAEAVHEGISPETMYISKHLSIDMGENARPYEVDNYDFIHRGPITLEKALADSDNTVFVQLALDLGLQKVVEMANELGVDTEIDAYPATAIGGLRVGVTPLEMASAYSTFANSGTHMEPYLVQKVTKDDRGKNTLLEKHRTIGEEVLSEDEAAIVTEALRGVVERGTASYYHDLDAEIGRPAAGKTGTSNEFIDAWFIGFIPQLSTSVWVGYPNERRSMVNINGLEEINGENYPLDIWSLYMQSAVQKYPVRQFDAPSPDLHLEVKTDDRTYVKPEPPPKPPPEKADEEKNGDTKEEGPGSRNTGAQREEPAPPESLQEPSAPDSGQEPPSQQITSSASPSSASPAPDGG